MALKQQQKRQKTKQKTPPKQSKQQKIKNTMTVLEWFIQSPDLNLIEML